MKPLKMRADVFVLDVLNAQRKKSDTPLQLFYKKSPYQIRGNVPTAEGMKPLERNRWRGEAHEHIWLRAEVKVPPLGKYERAEFCFDTGDMNLLYQPQMLVYINGEIVCALDTQHKNVFLDHEGTYEIFIYTYCNCESSFDMEFRASLVITDKNVEDLYYDLLAPLQIMDYSKEDSKVLLIVARKTQLHQIVSAIKRIDNKAFVSVSTATSVYGEGFEEMKTGIKIKPKSQKNG